MNTPTLNPCEECKGTGETIIEKHNCDCPDCLGTGLKQPQKRIMQLEYRLAVARKQCDTLASAIDHIEKTISICKCCGSIEAATKIDKIIAAVKGELMSNTTQTIEILRQFNDWRRGDESIAQPDPTTIGIAIDDAIKCIEAFDRLNESLDKNKRLFTNALADKIIESQLKRIKQLEDDLSLANQTMHKMKKEYP